MTCKQFSALVACMDPETMTLGEQSAIIGHLKRCPACMVKVVHFLATHAPECPEAVERGKAAFDRYAAAARHDPELERPGVL